MNFKEELRNYIKKNYKEPMVLSSIQMDEMADEAQENATLDVPVEHIRRDSAPRGLRKVHAPCSMPKAVPAEFTEKLKPTFQQILFKLIDERDLKDSEVYKASGIDRRLFSKIRSDIHYQSSRETVIQLCFGLKLEIDTALDLLGSAGYTLSFSKMEDVIIRFFLEKKNYSLLELNNTLYEYDLKPVMD